MILPVFPLEVRNGASVATIYHEKAGERDRFVLAYYAGGKRKREKFSDLVRAKKRARDITDSVKDGNLDGLALSREECVLYRRACELIAPLRIDFYSALVDYAEARRTLGACSVAEAARHFARTNAGDLRSVTVEELFNELIADKRADGASAVYVKDLAVRLGKFKEAFQVGVRDLNADGINTWLRGLKLGGRSRNNYRRAIGTFLKYAELKRAVTKGTFDLEQIALAKEEAFRIDIFTPEEMGKLIQATRLKGKPGVNRRYIGHGLLPLLLLGGFAGLRTFEITRQRWEDINLERGFIRVSDVKGNTAANRLVPISENLKVWLRECAKSGACCTHARPIDALSRLAERAGIAWKHNALRHSFISYRVAETQNIPQVSLEAGNSVQMINRHYREVVTPEQAKAWFAIVPSLT